MKGKPFGNKNHFIHGLRKHPLYGVWANMKTRCENPNDKHYSRWGGRGIRVCEEWHDFKRFYDWAISNGYSEGLTIDRIDNNGNYEPSNCRWVTVLEQNQNKRNVILLTHNGETKTCAEWSRMFGLSKNTVYSRFHKGWTVEQCLFGKRVIK